MAISFYLSFLLLLLSLLQAKAELHPSLDQEHSPGQNGGGLPTSDKGAGAMRSLQTCPSGELWESYSGTCVVNDCSSPRACTLHGETCRNVRRICDPRWGEDRICGQYICDSACPQYEQLDPVTNQCIPVSCSSLRACENAGPGRECLRMSVTDCTPGRPCPQFRCCNSIERCSTLYCAFGNRQDADGCPMCDCNACFGPNGAWGNDYTGEMLVDSGSRKYRSMMSRGRRVAVGGGGGGIDHRKNKDHRDMQYCPFGHEVNSDGCPLKRCRQTPW